MNGITMRMLTHPREDDDRRPEETRRRTREESREDWPEDRRTMAYGYPMERRRPAEPYRWEPDHDQPKRMEPRAGLYDGGRLGFGAAHYDTGAPTRQDDRRPTAIKASGTVWMDSPEAEEDDPAPIDRETAMRWVDSMEGTDPNHPHGGKWSPEALKPLAQKEGFPPDGPEFWAFYAVANAMYSDYAATAKRYGIHSPDFYADMAADFIRDADAAPDKVEKYLRYIVRK